MVRNNPGPERELSILRTQHSADERQSSLARPAPASDGYRKLSRRPGQLQRMAPRIPSPDWRENWCSSLFLTKHGATARTTTENEPRRLLFTATPFRSRAAQPHRGDRRSGRTMSQNFADQRSYRMMSLCAFACHIESPYFLPGFAHCPPQPRRRSCRKPSQSPLLRVLGYGIGAMGVSEL